MKALLILFTLIAPAYAEVQYTPNTVAWPTFNTPPQQSTTVCVTIASPPSGNQQYPTSTYTVCN